MEQSNFDNHHKRIEQKEIVSGYSISRVIKGGWQLAGGHGQIDSKKAIQDMYDFVKNGITTFDMADIYTGVEVNTIQLQYSLLDNRPEKNMLTYCQEKQIQFLCYGTLAGGFLSNKYLNQNQPIDDENRSLTKYKLIIEDWGGWDLFQELLQILSKIAKKYKTSISNIASRFILQKHLVAGVIIGARNNQYLSDTNKIFDFELDSLDKKEIEEVITKSKMLEGDCYSLERENSKHTGIMKYNLNKK